MNKIDKKEKDEKLILDENEKKENLELNLNNIERKEKTEEKRASGLDSPRRSERFADSRQSNKIDFSRLDSSIEEAIQKRLAEEKERLRRDKMKIRNARKQEKNSIDN